MKKKKLIPLPKLLKKAEKAFNAWIRVRDFVRPCISCGKFNDLQAGHYVPVSKSSFLRFHEWNVNGECAGCNGFDPFHLVPYRKNLIVRIGLGPVEELEKNIGRVHKWHREDLNQIILKYVLVDFQGQVSSNPAPF